MHKHLRTSKSGPYKIGSCQEINKKDHKFIFFQIILQSTQPNPIIFRPQQLNKNISHGTTHTGTYIACISRASDRVRKKITNYVEIFRNIMRKKHPGSRASFNFPVAENWEEKKALHKSRQFFEVAAAPKFGLVSPDKTGFSSASIIF